MLRSRHKATGWLQHFLRLFARVAGVPSSFSQELKMTTMEVSEALERVDNIVHMLDEICDYMDGFSSVEEAWLSNITETLRTWRYVMRETYEGAEDKKED
jgi:hypothetical protein